MKIDRFKREDGYYDSENNDRFYNNAEEWFQIREFDYCDCGDPNVNIELVYKGLAHLKKWTTDGWEKNLSLDDWDKEGIEIFGNLDSRQFFFYWLDSKNFTEHGGSIPGWLTPEGEDLLEDLTEYFEKGLNEDE